MMSDKLIKLGELIIDHTGEPRTLNYMMKQETFFMRRKWIEMEEANAALVKRWADLGEWVKFYKGTGSGNEFYRGTIKHKMKELQNG